MKLLFDQNISYRILKVLPSQMKDSSNVKFENLENATDLQIWEFAKKNNFTIVTMDSDFNDISTLLGFPPKVIWIRVGNLQTKDIRGKLVTYMEDIKHFIEKMDFGCYEIGKFSWKI